MCLGCEEIILIGRGSAGMTFSVCVEENCRRGLISRSDSPSVYMRAEAEIHSHRLTDSPVGVKRSELKNDDLSR